MNNTGLFPKILSTLICLIILPFIQIPSAIAIEIDADRQLGFAEHYLVNEKFRQAGDEFKRFIYFFPQDPRVHQAQYSAGIAYMKADDLHEALDAFNEIITMGPSSPFYVQTHYRIAEIYEKESDFGQALLTLNNLALTEPKPSVANEIHYRKGWLHLFTGDLNKAKTEFSSIHQTDRASFKVSRLLEELAKAKTLPQKDPQTAGMLAVLPGAGHVYCDRYQDGAIAFLLNTGFIWAAVESFDSGNDALGGLLSFVGFGFYAGNIYGAVNAAQKYNRNRQRRFIDNLKSNFRISLSAAPEKGMMLSFQGKF